MTRIPKHFMPYQARWVRDRSRLKLIEKSRQIGISYADAYDSVAAAADSDKGLDVWISSRDKLASSLYLRDCKYWARFLDLAARDLGEIVLNPATKSSAYALEFANDRRIYCLSSDPDALAGKRGHVKLDEFCLHSNQRELYRVAKAVTQWGGSLSIISTHRGIHTTFNQLIQDIKHSGNPMGWSFHSVPLHAAVAQGLVERINQKIAGRASRERRHPAGVSPVHPPGETREQFLARLRAECIDEEQWLQDHCCTPADESSSFISYEMIESCEVPGLTLVPHHLSTDDFQAALSSPLPLNPNPNLNLNLSSPSLSHAPTLSRSHALPALYLGLDIARKHDLCVFDLGEKIGDVLWDRARIELRNAPFSEIEFHLYRLLSLPGMKRCCIDQNGLAMQLAENARKKFGYRVEPVTFTPQSKEDMAYKLRHAFEDRKLRIPRDDALRADLRGIKKELTSAGNIRFGGEAPDSHCDRFWAKALRQHASASPAVWCPCPIPVTSESRSAFHRARTAPYDFLA